MTLTGLHSAGDAHVIADGWTGVAFARVNEMREGPMA